jgi:hypothetical protein
MISERERERETERQIQTIYRYIYIYILICLYEYIYVQVHDFFIIARVGGSGRRGQALPCGFDLGKRMFHALFVCEFKVMKYITRKGSVGFHHGPGASCRSAPAPSLHHQQQQQQQQQQQHHNSHNN